MIYDNITVLFSDGRSGSHAIYMWLLNNMEDTFGISSAHELIKNHPLGHQVIKGGMDKKNLLFRAEFINADIQREQIFRHIDIHDGSFKCVDNICNNFQMFMLLRDFYNYIASFISVARIKPEFTEGKIISKARMWRERAERYMEGDVDFILYNKWDTSAEYRAEIKKIFSDQPVIDDNKHLYNFSEKWVGLQSGFDTEDRHQRFKELVPEEMDLFRRILDDNQDLCKLSDEIFGKIYS